MLHVKGSPASLVGNPLFLGGEGETIDWRWMMSAVHRRLGLIVKLALVCAALAAVYVVMRPVIYKSHTQLLLTNLKLTFSRDDALFAESLPDPSFLETQMQIVRSERIALAVVDRLRLAESSTEMPGLVERLREGAASWVSGLIPEEPDGAARSPLDGALRGIAEALQPAAAEGPRNPGEMRRAAMRRLQQDYSVERVGMSNIVMIVATAPDPEEAARIANEIARAYVDDQVAARIEAAQSASIWLRERLRDVGPKTRIIAQGAPPTDKSNPRGLLIVALAALAGCAFGVTYALLRQMLDRTVQSPEQIVRATGAECLGIVPRLHRVARLRSWRERLRRKGPLLRQLPLSGYAAKHPFSAFAQTMSHAKVAIDAGLAGRAPRWIGVTSTFPGEGASTVAANLAHVIAACGERVLLIDCNATDSGLTKRLLRQSQDGLIECLAVGKARPADLVQTDPADGLHFLPIGHATSHCSAPIWTEAMHTLLKGTKKDYDYVICDLAPLASGAEVRAAVQYLGGVILVAGWGQVEAEHLGIGVAQAGLLRDKLLGTVLNRVNVAALRRAGSPAAAFLYRASGRAGARA
ncbi:tyrosine-protein kinase domain-containing protein [Methylobacterium sp. Leaf112]|jgi:Mrp family chromosome partitioning ATPase/capsular polysaccharide biosynthesis protein|uniref:tyrosine-protein kinase domain-containing protein n=1 Tax=Methylobacterium sp. Leaf112 TaxID=1736258 RepID=UPI0006FBCD4B|nr:tyrosine-protein kinase domain-containing protein [Methylobacterium sp. Leaf112]KQP70870.1 hypothetical protein ASF52_15935 [Methylobacterium sp. Leaf112]